MSTARCGSERKHPCSLKAAPESFLEGVLSYTDEELVSQYFVHNAKPSTYDVKAFQNKRLLEKRALQLIANEGTIDFLHIEFNRC